MLRIGSGCSRNFHDQIESIGWNFILEIGFRDCQGLEAFVVKLRVNESLCLKNFYDQIGSIGRNFFLEISFSGFQELLIG